jgi:hypothetical protein
MISLLPADRCSPYQAVSSRQNPVHKATSHSFLRNAASPGRHQLDAGLAKATSGALRLLVSMPSWEGYLTLGFDEIRNNGATSVQVMRRLRVVLGKRAKPRPM